MRGPSPNLATIRRCIAAVYRTLGRERVLGSHTLDPSDVEPFTYLNPLAAGSGLDPTQKADVKQLAGRIVRLLDLPDAPVAIEYRDLTGVHAAEVALGGAGYTITIHARLDPRDIPTVLGHEVMHVFLDRHGLRLPGRDNEILTDTAAVYLGVGWPILESKRSYTVPDRGGRSAVRKTFALGYLTSSEYGYLLAKRCREITGSDPYELVLSDGGRRAVLEGRATVHEDWSRPPLADGSGDAQRRFDEEWRVVRAGALDPYATRAEPQWGVRFDRDEHGCPRTIARCPRCTRRIRLTLVRGQRFRCPTCREHLMCRVGT